MKRKWKRELGEVFWAPPAKRKEEFFQSLELPGISFLGIFETADSVYP